MSSWAEPLPSVPGRVADFLAWRPEWPAAVAVGSAWAWLAVAGSQATSGTMTAGHPHGGTMMTPRTWAVMCVAMMLPLALPAMRHVALNSVRGRRQSGMALFAVGYLAPWLLLGLLALPLGRLLVEGGGATLAPVAVLLAVAAAWQLTPLKRWAVLSCSRTVPLAPYGPRAWWSRVEFGVRQALRCLAVCWPVMVLMVVLPHGPVGLAAMVLLTAMMLVEMRSRRRRLLLPWLAAPLGVAAVVAGAVAL